MNKTDLGLTLQRYYELNAQAGRLLVEIERIEQETPGLREFARAAREADDIHDAIRRVQQITRPAVA